jgi:hypothetical protein
MYRRDSRHDLGVAAVLRSWPARRPLTAAVVAARDGLLDHRQQLASQALQQICAVKVGLAYVPPGTQWLNGQIE